MVNNYMLPSKMLLSASPAFLSNQIILLISSVIWVFLINFLSKIFPINNYIYDGPNAPIINFSVYIYKVICATLGIIPKGPSVFRSCGENYDINNGLIMRPTYGNNKHLNKISCSVGEFYKFYC